MHKLLLRQLRRYLGLDSIKTLSADQQALMMAISNAYEEFDTDHLLVEQSLDLTSQEMMTINQELQQTIAKLSDSEEKFLQFANNLNQVFWLYDCSQKRFVFVSSAYQDLWGKSVDELYSNPKDWTDIIHSEDKARVIDNFNKDGLINGKFDETYRLNQTNGSVRWIHDRAFPVFNDQGQLYRLAGIAEDITDNKKLADAKSDFVSLASHQLRNPLATLRWNFEIIRDKIDDFPDTLKRLMKDADAAIARMAETTNAMLTVSKIESNNVYISKERVYLIDVINQVISEYAAEIESQGHTLLLEVDSNISLYSDAKLLLEILANLLSNAVKYTLPKGTITVQSTVEDGHLNISVTDNGIGIPVSSNHQVFEKMFRAENARQLDSNGTGLGLYVAKELTQVLGGEISFVSDQKQGTSMTLKFPATQLASS